jgi:pimeloyl-ACP methyl ester carboxylesterase
MTMTESGEPHQPTEAPRRRRWIAWAGIALIVLVAAYVVIGSWIASSLVGQLMDDVQAEVNAGSGEETTDPFDIAFRGDPVQALGYEYETVMVPTELGDAPAWFVPGEGTTWVIYVHGIGGVRENGYRHLSVLQPLQIPTLLITYRNDEGAPADPSGMYGFGLTEWRDLEASVDYALANGAERVILDGESMGGAIVGEFLRRSDRVDRVAAVIFDSPALDLRLVARHLMRENNVPMPISISFLGLWFADLRYDIPISTARTIDTVVGFDGPLFVAHGSGDGLVPIAITDEVVTRRHGATTYLRTESGHIVSWRDHPDQYRAWLHGFLVTVTQPTS